MGTGRYILDADQQPVEELDLLTWAHWMDSHQHREVARDTVGDVLVSTVFLGINRRFVGDGPAILYETMVFGGPLSNEMDRYTTRDEAIAGHAAMLARVLAHTETGTP